jgi:hypothetical protein
LATDQMIAAIAEPLPWAWKARQVAAYDPERRELQRRPAPSAVAEIAAATLTQTI